MAYGGSEWNNEVHPSHRDRLLSRMQATWLTGLNSETYDLRRAGRIMSSTERASDVSRFCFREVLLFETWSGQLLASRVAGDALRNWPVLLVDCRISLVFQRHEPDLSWMRQPKRYWTASRTAIRIVQTRRDGSEGVADDKASLGAFVRRRQPFGAPQGHPPSVSCRCRRLSLSFEVLVSCWLVVWCWHCDAACSWAWVRVRRLQDQIPRRQVKCRCKYEVTTHRHIHLRCVDLCGVILITQPTSLLP